MQKCKGFWLAVLAVLLFAGSAFADVLLTTGQPMVAEKGKEESPSQIEFKVTSDKDYKTAVGSDYYTYVYFMNGVVLAHSIGNDAVGTAIQKYESGEITAAQAKAMYAAGPTTEEEASVATPDNVHHLTVDQLGNYAGPTVTDFGIWGLKGSNWLVVRVPGATNTLNESAAELLRFTIRNLCIDLQGSPLTVDDLVQVTLASPAVNNPLDHYPNSFDRDDTIAAYPTDTSKIAIIGPQSPFDIVIKDCTKGLRNVSYASTTLEIEDCDFDPDQDKCYPYQKCFILERTDGGKLFGLENKIVLDPSTGVYIPKIESVEFYHFSGGVWEDVTSEFTNVAVSYFGDCQSVNSTNQVTYTTTNSTLLAGSQLGVVVDYMVNTALVNVGDQLTMDVYYSKDAQRICGSNIFDGTTNLARMIACTGGGAAHEILFPYVYYGIGGWDTAMAISNLSGGNDAWDLTFELVDADGGIHLYKKENIPGKQDVFFLNDIIGLFDGTALTTGTGYMRIFSNRNVHGFAYYQGPSLGAGVNAERYDW